jgi:hypothetical protein
VSSTFHSLGPALVLALLVASSAQAGGRAELEGVVRNGQGRPIAGADVVATAVGVTVRRAAVTDKQGRFHLVLPNGGVWRVLFFEIRGPAVVGARLVSVPPGARVHLDLTAERSQTPAALPTVSAAVMAPTAAGQVALLAPQAATAPAPLVRGRDLGDAVAAFAGGQAASAATLGPTLLGTGEGEIAVRLDDFDLRDPVDGTGPWELPLVLFSGVAAGHDLGLIPEGAGGGGAIRLWSRAAERAGEARATLGSAAVATPKAGRGGGRPSGPDLGQRFEMNAGTVTAAGRLGLSLAAAPVLAPWQGDPESPRFARARRTDVAPVLARADAALGSWALALVGLGSCAQMEYSRPDRIVPLSAPATARRELGLLALTAGRPIGHGSGEIILRAAALGTRRDVQNVGEERARTRAGRTGLWLEGRQPGDLLGRHLLQGAAGVGIATARRPGPQPSRQSGFDVLNARASALRPWITVGDRYAPARFLELELGVHLEKDLYEGLSAVGGEVITRAFSTELLAAPRGRIALLDRASGSTLYLAAGRYGALVPLEPLLGAAFGPRNSLDPPVEDLAIVGGELRRRGLVLALTAVERRTRTVIEDRFSPVTGKLELWNPEGARRRYRALALQALKTRGRTRGGVAAIRSSLAGNHVGFADLSVGETRPASSAAWDAEEVQANRGGPLPFDRPWSLRAFAAQRWSLAGLPLEIGAAGRVDSGTPLSALGRSARSGEGQIFVLRRGALGRTAWTGTVDAVARISHNYGRARLSLALETFNLLDHRGVLARDQAFTDHAALPLPGAGRDRLGEARGPDGAELVGREGFLAPVAYTEPRLVRLLFTLEL